MGAVKVATHPHFIPTLRLNRPRREVSRVRGNAAKGLGTIEMVSPPPPSRTKWTRRVPHPVLIGHAASLILY